MDFGVQRSTYPYSEITTKAKECQHNKMFKSGTSNANSAIFPSILVDLINLLGREVAPKSSDQAEMSFNTKYHSNVCGKLTWKQMMVGISMEARISFYRMYFLTILPNLGFVMQKNENHSNLISRMIGLNGYTISGNKNPNMNMKVVLLTSLY